MILGPIVRIQIQRTPLKTPGVGYDPRPIVAVEEAVIGPPGLVGRHEGSWILDARPLPPHAVIPGLEIDGQPLGDWKTLAHLTKKQREFVVKPQSDGFTPELAMRNDVVREKTDIKMGFGELHA